jgi:hypothetical protein
MENSYEKDSLFARAFDPPVQAAVILALAFVLILGGKLVALSGITHVGERFPWLLAASMLLFFSVFNSVFLLSSKDLNRYWSRSMLSFIGLALGAGALAWLFSGLTIGQAGSFRWIFFVVTFAYLVFMSITRFLKVAVEFAQREEWTQPRLKNRSRRK